MSNLEEEEARAPGRRVCYLHVGTHKTGTTALQDYLGENDALLAAEGTLYPRSGRMQPGSGQHNIAFQLSGDERFRPSLGTVADLLDEVAAVALPRVCVSTEALQFVHDRPDRLRALRDGLAAIGYRAVVVVYLRAQCDYLESLYPTLLHHGYTVSFKDYLERVLADGIVRHRVTRSYRFDYASLLGGYAGVFGPDGVIVRAYAKADDPAWIVRDFFAALGPPAHRPVESGSRPRLVNLRPRLDEVARLLLRNRECEPSAATEQLLERVAGLPFAPLDAPALSRVGHCFAAGNQRVERRWGLSVEAAPRDALAQRGEAVLRIDSPQHAARAVSRALERDSARVRQPGRV